MKLVGVRKHVLVSLVLLGTLVVLLASIGSVHGTITTVIKEHHPPSTFKDPSGTYDGYLVGQTITWHIHVNVTSSKAPFPWISINNLTITDTLPNLLVGGPLYMTYVSGSQNSSSAAGAAAFADFGNGTLFWNFGTGPFTTGVLAPPPFSNANEFYTASVTFNATILGTVTDNTFLTNTCAVSYTETASGAHSAPGTSDTIWVPRPPILNIVKVNPAKVENGSNFNYVLQLSNTGYKDAVGVRVEDVMPTGVTHTPPATATSGSFLTDTSTDVVWTGTIPNVTSPVNTVNITIPVKANTALTSVFNSASFTAFSSDAHFTNQSANCTTVVIHPAIALTKTPSASKVENGTMVTYTYNVTNIGDTSLTVSLIDDTYGTIFSGKILAAGASNVTTISKTLSASTTNVAAATGVDQTGANVSATATATVQVIHPAISLTKTPSASKVEMGTNVTYTYNVTNTGDTTLSAVNVTDNALGTIASGQTLTAGQSMLFTRSAVLTANTTNVAAAFGVDQTGATASATATAVVQVIHPAISLTKTPSASKVESGSTVNYTYVVTNTGDTSLTVGLSDSAFGTIFSGKVLAAGASNVTTVSRVVVANTTNTATATGVDQAGAAISVNATAFVQVIHPAISLTKTPSASKVESGSSVTYTFTVTNTGDASLTVGLVDNVFGAIFSGKVLAAGASNVTTVSRVVVANTTNIATVTGVDQTGVRVSANANATVQVIHPAISLTKTPSASKVESGSTVKCGSCYCQPSQPQCQVNYTYVVTNTGDTSLTVGLVDSAFGTIFSGKVLAAGASNTTVICEVIAANTTNTATVTGVDQAGVRVSANATAFVHVIHPAISLTKTPSSSKVESGSTVNYTYVVTNTGDTSLTVSLTDSVFGTIFSGKVLAAGASNTTVVSEVLTTNTTCYSCDCGSGGCGCQCERYCNCSGVSNVATAVGVDQAGVRVSANATAFVQVIHPAITLTKTPSLITSQGCGCQGGCDGVVAPATFMYTYTVTNTGDTTLTGVTVFDQTFNVQIKIGTTTLVPGQSTKGTYNKTYTSPGTYFDIANATGTDQVGAKVTAFANATVTVTAPVQTTRTWGFWETHTCFTEYVFDHKLKDFIAIDSGTSHARNITSYAVLFGAFEADVAKTSKSTKRLAIDSARISLLHQMLAAILNTAAFNTAVPKDPVTGLNLIQAANIAYSGNNAAEINRLEGLLDTFNGSGDNVALPPGLPNPGNATPFASLAIANIAFWDKL